jgi:lysophospholipase L1-like esterase
MRKILRRSVASGVLILLYSVASVSAQGALPRDSSDEHWVPTWGTAQLLLRIPPPQGAPAPAPNTLQTVNHQTVRMIVRTSIGGKRTRVKLSNSFGSPAVTIGAAHIAKRSQGAGIAQGTDRALTFAGRTSIRIAPGGVVVSDPVAIEFAPLTDLAVSLYLPEDTGPPTIHSSALRTTYVSGDGDFTAAADLSEPRTTTSYYWLASIEVDAPKNTAAIVTFGDSITDGARSTVDTHNTWPALLASRLAAQKSTANIAVVNEGIGGNRVLTDAAGLAGVNALARLDRDVFSHPGVKWLMVMEGINDIGALAQPTSPYRVTAEDLIAAYQQIIERAHALGIRVIGCTLTPYGGAGYFTDQGEVIRDAVNQWIRTSKAFDAVVDFEAATRDSANADKFRPEFDPGDHLHPNDAGYKAMADAINLAMFK